MDGGAPIPIGTQLPLGQPPPLQSGQQLPMSAALPGNSAGGAGGGGGAGGQGGAPPALPPQMFTTSSQLLDLTDKKLLVMLRDGRKLIGVLRTWDQYANLVLQSTIERIIVDDIYHDLQRGIYIVRGENVLLLGEIDLDKEDETPYKQASYEEVFARQKQRDAEKKRRDKVTKKKLAALGFELESEALV